MHPFRPILIVGVLLAIALTGCGSGSSSSKPRPRSSSSAPAQSPSPSHTSPTAAMLGLLAAMKSDNNHQVLQWLSPAPKANRGIIRATAKQAAQLGLGKLFWEVERDTIVKTQTYTNGVAITLSHPIVWCLGKGPQANKVTCAQPNGSQGQAPVYPAVNQGGQWYIDMNINIGRTLKHNPHN